MEPRSVSIPIDLPDLDALPGRLTRPPDARALYVFAHGAGAGMDHRFMADAAERLARRRVAVLRYDLPYMARGSRRPDRPPVAVAGVRAAVAEAARLEPDLVRFAGGKSFGGRMTSTAEAESPLGVRGLVFFGFPLHPAGRPGTSRARHLSDVHVPMLFLQGDRDALAGLDLLTPVVDGLASATLHVEFGADHGFHVLKRSGRTDDEVLDTLADRAAAWMIELAG